MAIAYWLQRSRFEVRRNLLLFHRLKIRADSVACFAIQRLLAGSRNKKLLEERTVKRDEE